MTWYEILIAIGAVAIVALPIVLHFVRKKKGKSSCSCGCDCASCDKCRYNNSSEKQH